MTDATESDVGGKKRPYPWGKVAPKARLDQLAKDAERTEAGLVALEEEYKKRRKRLMNDKGRISRQRSEVEAYLADREQLARRRKLNGIFERLIGDGIDIDVLTSDGFIEAALEAAGKRESDAPASAAAVAPRRKGGRAGGIGDTRAENQGAGAGPGGQVASSAGEAVT